MNSRDSRGGLALLTGVLIGIGLSFLMPDEWKETAKEKVKRTGQKAKDMFENSGLYDKLSELYENNSDKARALYEDITEGVTSSLERMGLTLQSVSKRKYSEVIEDALERIQAEHELPDEQIKKLRRYLSEDYSRIEASAKKQ